MKEIAVMSGKGGTGKTSITAALGVVAGSKALLADCDVDASNLHLLYQPEIIYQEIFKSGKLAVIDYDLCIDCGICRDKCAFEAIDLTDGKYVIDEVGCEGCSVCSYVCPDNAIEMRETVAGKWFQSKSRFGNWLLYARLDIGQENSGQLVSKVKEESGKLARANNIPFILVDGPPGVGCPVISTFAGLSHVLIVSEATESGLHDMIRLIDMVEHFKVSASCIINKADLNKNVGDKIKKTCRQHAIAVLEEIPFNATFYKTLQQGKTLMEGGDALLEKKITKIWNFLENLEG